MGHAYQIMNELFEFHEFYCLNLERQLYLDDINLNQFSNECSLMRAKF